MSAAIVNAFLSRVSAINITGGFNTDSGDNASIAERQYNSDEVTAAGAVNVFDISDTNEDEEIVGNSILLRIDVTVEGHIRVGANNPVTLAHQLQTDIKKAVLLVDDRTMGGLVMDVRYVGREISYPESAGDVVSVVVNFYVLYFESYGAP